MNSKTLKKAAALLLSAAMMACALFPVCAFAAEDNEAKLSIPVEKVLTGNRPSTPETFTFQLKALDSAPMPEGAVEGVITTTIDGAGTGAFPEITYTDARTYKYEVSEIKGTNRRYTYDSQVYTITVQTVYEEREGGAQQLVANLTPYVDGQETKPDKIVFSNRYTRPSDDGGGGGNRLDISKKVTGIGDKEALFEFIVRLDGKLYNGTYYIGGKQYTAQNGIIKLKDGQTAEIRTVSAGTKYVVTEKDYTAWGYTTTAENETGTITSGTKHVWYTNYGEELPPDTGTDTPYGVLWTLFGLCCIGLIVRIYRSKKNNGSENKSE